MTTRALIIYAGHLGDLVMATPAIDHLQHIYGKDIQIDWLARSPFEAIFDNDPRINRVFSLKHMNLAWPLSPPKLRVIWHSWRQPYDITITLNGGNAKSLMRMIRSHKKISPPTDHSTLPRHRVEQMQAYYVNSLYKNGPPMYLAPKLQMSQHQATLSLPDNYMILVATTSKFKSTSPSGFKNWPMSHWLELIPLLLDTYPGQLIITHTQKETQFVQPLVNIDRNRVISLTPSLPDLTHAIQHAALIVSGDTGPIHIANAVGTPIIGLFGPTAPQKTGPYLKNNKTVILSAALDCIACEKQIPCNFNRCMHELTPQLVSKACQQLLA